MKTTTTTRKSSVHATPPPNPSYADFEKAWCQGLTPAQLKECKSFVGESVESRCVQWLHRMLLSGKSRPAIYAWLGEKWPRINFLAMIHDDVKIILGLATRRDLNVMMTAEELAAWKKLPNTVTAYRCYCGKNQDGFCYFLRQEAAEKYSTRRRHRQFGRKDRGIVVAAIPKKYCVFKRCKAGDEIIATRPEELIPSRLDPAVTT